MSEENPPIAALAAITVQNDAKRLQLYADGIRSLEFSGEDCNHHRLFRDVKFPKLERISIDASEENEGSLLEPYLQPNLKVFEFYGGRISDDFLEKLQVSSACLTWFHSLTCSRNYAHSSKKSSSITLAT
jgi:hypothetical protein